MSLNESVRDTSVPEDDARRELERLLCDTRFRATERTKSILQYLANRYFDGYEDSVKAYAIALDVLGRPSDFDAGTDPIVRIEVSRLRSALSQYYEAFGGETDILIELPKGKYVVSFVHDVKDCPRRVQHSKKPLSNADMAGEAELEHHDSVAPANEVQPKRSSLPFAIFGGLLLLAVISAIGAIWLHPVVTQRPTVVLTMSSPQSELVGDATVTRDMLMTALTQFRTLSIAAQKPAETFLLRSMSNTYSIELKYYGDDTGRSVWWQIVDPETGKLLKAGIERANADGRTELAVRDELVHVLARRFATKRGMISTIEMQTSASNALGNVCVLRGEIYLEDERPDDLDGITSCLARTISEDPTNSDAMATLSRVLISQTTTMSDALVQERALELANRAVAIAPLSDRALISLMVAQFIGGRTQAAISAGNRALAVNPNNPDVSAKLGLVLYVSGYREGGLALANDAGRSVNAIPRDASLVLALDAYNRRDWSSASILSEQINNGGFLIDVLKVAALGELKAIEAFKRLDDVRTRYPNFESRYSQMMESSRFDPALTAGIKAGLLKAGAEFNSPRMASTLTH
ncbi:hypothetical protein DXT91_27055 [Agrobacterium tumefaciens]|uniref:tetratricopeptide repeat protein n=1 Tax=Agrobacterium tumefaciens TaxID=358 RepID=UPI0012B87887|nr:hypothetical protein [Agrobacterium tumefaciens]MQB07717.1 hypothetical protein [Agrobacterium tumefaciens]